MANTPIFSTRIRTTGADTIFAAKIMYFLGIGCYSIYVVSGLSVSVFFSKTILQREQKKKNYHIDQHSITIHKHTGTIKYHRLVIYGIFF